MVSVSRNISRSWVKRPYIYDIHTEEGWWGVLQICDLFTNSIIFKQ